MVCTAMVYMGRLKQSERITVQFKEPARYPAL